MQNKTGLLVIILLMLTQLSFSQKTDSLKPITHFSGSATVTNNGISIVPSFSLGKPAAIVNLSMSKNRFSFEPDLRFSLAGKPWSFLFWGRYKVVTGSRFQLNTGAHLGLNFKQSMVPKFEDSGMVTITRRYAAGELSPQYSLTKNISIGAYYLYSHGLDEGTIGNTHFITFNANFSNIKISDQFYMKVNPALYYLKLDAKDGFYATSSFTLAKQDFPFSVSAIINKEIHSNIAGSKDLLWNASLVYSFN